MARGIANKTSAAITTNTTTNIIPAPAAGETVYLSYLSVDVGTAGTGWVATFQPTTTTAAFKLVFAPNALGHQDANPGSVEHGGHDRYPGVALPVGEGLDCVTSGTTPGSFFVTAVYEIR